ncbi:MAG: hypothetical protein ACR2N4_10975 [Jatrophihabitans sp.]
MRLPEPTQRREDLAGRSYPRVYRTTGKLDVWRFLLHAVEKSGAHVVSATDHRRAPVFIGATTAAGERLGMLVYPFRSTTKVTNKRPADESRTQIRLGSEDVWVEEHHVAFDPASVDITMVLGCHLDSGVFIGFDPIAYDPLPMGSSVWVKDAEVARAADLGWHPLTKETHSGVKRSDARADGLETLVLFTPDRLIDYAYLDRRSIDLGLDPPLRYSAALAVAEPAGGDSGTLHALEAQFGLSSPEILDIIAGRSRLSVAVRGGVAEHHLQKALDASPHVASATRLDQDGEPDFDVELTNGQHIRIECKNASPTRYANGDDRVEVQKTRASKGDPASRFYEVSHFDIVAACLFSTAGEWVFRFHKSATLERHAVFGDRLAPLQRVNSTWHADLGWL